MHDDVQSNYQIEISLISIYYSDHMTIVELLCCGGGKRSGYLTIEFLCCRIYRFGRDVDC